MRAPIHYRKSTGLSLVELLVAMAVGLIVVIVIGQLVSASEGQKRTATSGADAMVNGALALYTIERDAKSAGYGMTTNMSSMGCEIRQKFGNNAVATLTLSPVTITNGDDGAPDTLRFLASNKNGVALPTRITVDHPKTAANFFVESDLGIQIGDLMIAVPETPSEDNWCSIFQTTGLGGSGQGQGQGQGQNQVLHNSGQSNWNQAGGQTIFPDDGYPAGSYLINLGQLLDHTYEIGNNNLRLTEFNSTTGVASPTQELFPQIVQLQAVYGKDTNNDCLVDAWNATQPATAPEWQQIRAIRMVLVARSQIAEKENVTLSEADVSSAKCNTDTPNPNLVCWRPDPASTSSGVQIKLDDTADWQRYRYRVFETTVPIRNLIWLQKTGNPACAL